MYKVEVIADNSGQWCGNGLTFATKELAEDYARDLFSRWTAVRQWRVIETCIVETTDTPLGSSAE